MVKPFPNEIWLDIFKGLAKEGEYDALERCRVVCREFQPMARECLGTCITFKNAEEVEQIKVDASGGRLRRWGGPQGVIITGGNSEDACRPIPHLATFASRLAGRWPGVEWLKITNAEWRARDLDLDAVLRDLAVFSITYLDLREVSLPSILTLGRIVCAFPRLKQLVLRDVQFIQNPFDANIISRVRLLPHLQLERLWLDHGHNGAEPRPSFVELVDVMTAISNRRCPVAPLSLAQASPWSAVRRLALGKVTFPSVTTFARLLCALPALGTLELWGPCAFVKHGFDLRSVPVHPGLPFQLANVQLIEDFSIGSDPCSVADLVEFFIATGVSENLRHIKACLSPILRVADEVDVALSRLVRHSAPSLRHLSLDSSLPYSRSNDKYELVHADHSAAPYFDISENACLEYLDLTIEIARENLSHLCAPVVEILSQVTSTHISVIQVYFSHDYQPGAELDVYLGKLMDGLPQLDAVLAGLIFNGLNNVVISVGKQGVWYERDEWDARDEASAYGLRLCLPRLDARGILGVGFNGILFSRIGLDCDEDTSESRHRGTERVAVQDTVVANAGTSAEDDRRTNNATTGAVPHEAATRRSRTFLVEYNGCTSTCRMCVRRWKCPSDATAGSVTSVDISAPDDHAKLQMEMEIKPLAWVSYVAEYETVPWDPG
ncbi:hypothetical protein IEO21_08868 [Rhodonia placenta]|uniref:F-box domain-containing protein n=1 Tax=Rhodonia placenta TaxID=104341 RepID=A0A8H7TYZ8_9APHY|nr:hypothetical protein IEO21_08868 [Postia placenta]